MKSKTKTEEWLYNNGYLDPHGTTRTYPSPEGEEGVIKETVELADVLDSFTLYLQEQNKEEIKTTSQPAGALVDTIMQELVAKKLQYGSPHQLEDIRTIIAQQTAAKDEELAQLRQQLDIWESNEPCEECGEAHECGVQAQLRDLRHLECEQQAREAAERERDSLKERQDVIRTLAEFAISNPENITRELLEQIVAQTKIK